MPRLRILSLAELEALSVQITFANAADVRVTTADVRPIDSVVGKLASGWGSYAVHAALPTLSYSGYLTHPPVPESIRKYTPKNTWDGYDEPVELLAQGVEVDGFRILFMKKAAKAHWEIFGAAQGGEALLSRRQIPMEAALAVNEDAVGAAWAAMEKDAISKGVHPGHPGSPAARI